MTDLVLNYFKYIDMKTKYKIVLVAFTILVVGIVMYITLPFPKFEQIQVFRAISTPDDKKGIFLDRLYAYNHYNYVHKGIPTRPTHNWGFSCSVIKWSNLLFGYNLTATEFTS